MCWLVNLIVCLLFGMALLVYYSSGSFGEKKKGNWVIEILSFLYLPWLLFSVLMNSASIY